MLLSGEDSYIVGAFNLGKGISLPRRLTFAFALNNHRAEQLTDLTNKSIDKIFDINGANTHYKVKVKINKTPLTGGFYTYNMMLRNNNDVQDFILGGGSFQVADGDFFNTDKTIEPGQGSLLFEQDWLLESIKGQL